MPTELDPKDLPSIPMTEIPAPPSPSDLEDTPAETDPAGTKEADAVASEPEIDIDAPSEELSEEDKTEDGGAKAEPSAEAEPVSDEASAEPSVSGGPDAPGEPSAEPSPVTDEPSAELGGADDSDSADSGGASGYDPATSDESTQPSLFDTDGPDLTSGGDQLAPEALSEEAEEGEGEAPTPPSAEEVEAIDAEVEPEADETEDLGGEETKPTAETQGAYKGLHDDKGGVGAELGPQGLETLLGAANQSFELVEVLREMADRASGSEKQEAQFILGIGSLWLAQLERWLARNS